MEVVGGWSLDLEEEDRGSHFVEACRMVVEVGMIEVDSLCRFGFRCRRLRGCRLNSQREACGSLSRNRSSCARLRTLSLWGC